MFEIFSNTYFGTNVPKSETKFEILKGFLTISSVTKTVSLKLYASKAMLSKN